MQTVISLPLGNGSSAAAVAARRERPNPPLADEFILGPENRLVSAAVKAIFAEEAHRLTPLVFYGPSGTGKTHLAGGVAEWWHRHHPAALVVNLTGAEFAQQYADAVETDRVGAWRARLRTADLLVLDGLGALTDKRGAQQELRQLLDDCEDRGALAIVVSLVLPALLEGLSEPLQSRLAGGLCIPVNLPEANTRKAILERLAQARGMSLSKHAIQTLADGMNVPVPQLLGALMELDRAAIGSGRAINNDDLRQYLQQHEREQAISIRSIAVASARYYGVKLAELKSPSRKQGVVTARNAVIYLARQLTSQSLEQIGAYFGGRDHTTILHSFRKTEALARSDAVTRQALAEIQRLIDKY